jgi:anti-anti-sigma factor
MSDVKIVLSGKNPVIVKITGQLDETNVDAESKDIYEEIEKAAEKTSFIFDLSGLTYMNSKSVGYMADWQGKVTGKGGKMVIAGAQEAIYDILNVVGLTSLIATFKTVADAKKGL